MIREVIIVEGRDDERAIADAVEATTIATHGYGISKETLEEIAWAYEKRGIIIFTDPDFAGEKIRKRLSQQFPNAGHAYLHREDARKGNDIGIENAKPEQIREALSKIKHHVVERRETFTFADIIHYGLSGTESATSRRAAAGKKLGIGTGNTKEFLKKLNQYAVTKEELEKALFQENK